MIDKIDGAPKGPELGEERLHGVPKPLETCRPQLHDQSSLSVTRKGFCKTLENSQFAALGINL